MSQVDLTKFFPDLIAIAMKDVDCAEFHSYALKLSEKSDFDSVFKLLANQHDAWAERWQYSNLHHPISCTPVGQWLDRYHPTVMQWLFEHGKQSALSNPTYTHGLAYLLCMEMEDRHKKAVAELKNAQRVKEIANR